ncbi:hypothetical protein [Mucilaginibacter gilvus]|uniref:Carboxypeptidase-like regulatory domain-containing protein n=1 Tax=Mucilaginibacter gilvus TaxID=2305909 RepID=A0A444MNY1_9SPHI|nr:hypothetical protein [Mucilaginibacter gilvus]RWY52324.1 hypothetical protein EPL05_10440 [Mucilaginibacter gilvus]
MKLWLPLLFCIVYVSAFAQQKEVTGIVFDKENKGRIAKVNVRNNNSGQSVYNTFKGEFTISANLGDVLVFSKADHHSDTITVKNYAPLAVYMKATAIQLKEVTIRDSVLNPQRRYRATKGEYGKIYGSLANQDLLSIGQGGVGFSIDALYNMFSRSGRNVEHLKEIIDRDYKQSVIDYRFNKSFVAGITVLKDPDLTDFMFKYRPSYYMVTTANEYEFVAYVRTSLRRYKRNPKAFELAPLPTQYINIK